LIVAAESFSDHVDVGSMLHGERKNDRGVTGDRVGLVAPFMVVQKKFADSAIVEAADHRGEL
jgi:hypothetical protein